MRRKILLKLAHLGSLSSYIFLYCLNTNSGANSDGD